MAKNLFMLSCAAAAVLSAGMASATELSFNDRMFVSDDAEFYSSYTFAADDIVSSLNGVSEAVLLKGHDYFGLAEAAPVKRLLYLLVAGSAVTQFNWTNSLFFGHEYVHHQNQHRFGLSDHYFRLNETGKVIPDFEAYKRILTGFEVGGPASSAPGDGPVFHIPMNAEGSLVAANSVNWQMRYSTRLARDMFQGDVSVFRAGDYLVNRAYTTLYSLGDSRRAPDGDATGDMTKFAIHITQDGEHPADVLDEMVTTGLLSAALSPATWAAFYSYNTYVASGEPVIHPYKLNLSGAQIFWDIPNYLTLDSYTVKPTVYIDIPAKSFDNLTVGIGYETAVIGADVSEVELYGTFAIGRAGFEGSIFSGDHGNAFEFGFSFAVTDSMKIKIGGFNQIGETLAGDRIAPEGNNVIFAGVNFEF